MHTVTFFLLLFSIILCPSLRVCFAMNQSATQVKFGLILNMSSSVGKMSSLSVSMALEDFYSKGNHTKKLVPRVRDSQEDALAAASAGLDLLKREGVEAIVGPQNSAEADFIANLGDKTHVPIISFSVTSPLLSSMKTTYFIRAAQDDSTQVNALAAIVKSKDWRRVVLIYEDDDYGRGMIPYLADAFQTIGVMVAHRSVIPLSAPDLYIELQLYKLMTMQTRVFVVHMSPALGAHFFKLVQKVGMMSTGYAWLVTNGIGNLLGDMDPFVIGSMQGVLGLQTYVPGSKKLNDFRERWTNRFKSEHPEIHNPQLNVYGLWAYDAIWALATAVERSDAGIVKFQHPKGPANSSDLFSLGVSPTGPGLLDAISISDFRGLAGYFRLVDGELQAAAFRVVNVVGVAEVEVGSWDPKSGLRNPSGNGFDLGSVTWPGGGREPPKGWVTPTNGKALKILVPVKDGFSEFVTVENSPPKVTGYSIDVFKAVVEALPYALPYEFVPYGNRSESDWSYNVLIDQIYYKNYDALVGDVTIIGNRSNYVDFTLPYSDSGVSMIVRVKATNKKKASVFLEPLTPQLWLASAAFFVFTGIVIWALEHRINPNFRGPPSEQIGLIFYYAFSTMVFAHNEKLASNLARIVVVIWVFVVLILTSSYTASLASILTVQQFQPTATDLESLITEGKMIGYQSGSFVEGMLIMKGAKNQMVALNTDQEYAEALRNGTVAAIVDEIPYIKVFLSKHCSGFTMVGPTYKTDGFGFVFPKGSPLTSDVSSAILNVTESDSMNKIEKAWLGSQSTCADAQEQLTSNRLSLYSFRGLFLLTGTVSLGAVLIFFFLFGLDYLRTDTPRRESLWQMLKSLAKHFDNKDLSSHTFMKERPMQTMRRNSAKVRDVPLEDQVIENVNHGSPARPSVQTESDQDLDEEIRVVESSSDVHEDSIRLAVEH